MTTMDKDRFLNQEDAPLIPREVPEIEEETTEEVEGNEDDRLERVLSSLGENSAKQAQVMSLLQDPEVQAVLALKGQGKKVQVMDQGQLPREEEKAPEPGKDLEEMTNQELVEFMVKRSVHELSKVVRDQIAGQVQPLQQGFQGVVQFLAQSAQKNVQTEIGILEKKYPDLENFKPAMAELNKDFGGKMTLEEMYLLAKARAGQGPSRASETERPTTTGSRPRVRQEREREKAPMGPGSSIEALIRGAAERVLGVAKR